MGLGEMLKIIYNLIKWEIWAIMQIFHIGKWLYGLVQSYMPSPPPKPFSLAPDGMPTPILSPDRVTGKRNCYKCSFPRRLISWVKARPQSLLSIAKGT